MHDDDHTLQLNRQNNKIMPYYNTPETPHKPHSNSMSLIPTPSKTSHTSVTDTSLKKQTVRNSHPIKHNTLSILRQKYTSLTKHNSHPNPTTTSPSKKKLQNKPHQLLISQQHKKIANGCCNEAMSTK